MIHIEIINKFYNDEPKKPEKNLAEIHMNSMSLREIEQKRAAQAISRAEMN